MRIALLGPLLLDGEAGRLPRRERTVLAALAARRGEVVSDDTLARAVWGEQPPDTWLKALQVCVVRLRKVLGADAIETVGRGYRLVVPAEELDTHRFERLVHRSRKLLGLREPDRAAYTAAEALALWRGRPYADLDFWAGGRIEGERLDLLRLEAEELHLESALRAGRHLPATEEAITLVAEAPLRERRWDLLARAQYQAGQVADALRTLREARKTFVAELGLEPGPELAALEQAILRQDTALLTTPRPPASPFCPYPGLLPYDVQDAEHFCGRQTEVAECLRRLADTGVLVVVGPSGSGKSSLVRAGVAAALERLGRVVTVLTPGSLPADALPPRSRAGELTAVVVDQLEEVVTPADAAENGAPLLTALSGYAERGLLVVAVRADRLGDVAVHPAFGPLVERGLYVLPRMGVDRLRESMEVPALQAGLVLEPGLVDLLIRDVEDEPGSLPLLSHALRQTWERREGNTMTVEGYRATGGIRGAVSQSAEQLYERATPRQREQLRDLLLRLVTFTDAGQPVRAKVPRRVLAPDPAREELLELLVAARLVTSDESAVEIAHEALARAWPRLRGWLEQDVEGQQVWRHLTSAADGWEAMGRPDSELYRGLRLATAHEWRERAGAELNPVELDFLEASARVAAGEQRRAEAEAVRQAAANRRLRALVAVVAVLAVVAAGFGTTAARQAQRADDQAVEARSHELAASAVSVVDDDPTLAKLLAVASTTQAPPTVQSMVALHRSWAADRSVLQFGASNRIGQIWVDAHPDGDMLVAAGFGPHDGSDTELEVVDPYTDVPFWQHDFSADGHSSAFVARPFFTADGKHLVAGSFWDPFNIRRRPTPLEAADEPVSAALGVHVFEARTGRLLERIDIGRCGGWVAAMSADHLLVRTLREPAVARSCRWGEGRIAVELVDRRTGQLRTLSTDAAEPWPSWGATLSGDGKYVAYQGDGQIVVADTASGEARLRMNGSALHELNHDGSLVLVGSGPVRVVDVATGEVVSSFAGHAAPVLHARFGPGGDTVFSAGDEGVLREWEIATGAESTTFPALSNGRPSFTHDGLVLMSRMDLDTATLVDPGLRGEIGAVPTCPGQVVPDSLVGARATLAFSIRCAGEKTTTTVVVQAGTLQQPIRVPGGAAGAAPAISPDGSRFVRQDGLDGAPGPVVVRDIDSGAVVRELGVPPGLRAAQLRWSPNGAFVGAVDQESGGAVVWDAASGDVAFQQRPDRRGTRVVDLIFSPDSGSVVMTFDSWMLREISTRSWEQLGSQAMFGGGGFAQRLVGFTADGVSLVGVGAFGAAPGGHLNWLEVGSYQDTRTRSDLHEGTVRAAALSPGGTRVATAGSEGAVRVWDTADGTLVHEIPVGADPLEGVAWVDEHRLAVTPQGGNVLVVTTDPAELREIVGSSLTRGFTAAECARFGFGNQCPTLAELRAPPAQTAPDPLAGRYTVSLTTEELLPRLLAVEGSSVAAEAAEAFAGDYTVTFAGGRFDLLHDAVEDPACVGTYDIRAERVWIRPERGAGCLPVKLFDAPFVVTSEQLRFDPGDYRGEPIFSPIFTTRPWSRSG